MKILISFLIVIIIFSGSLVLAQVMSSPNYQIQKDSLNVGGGEQSSANYLMTETLGELATGDLASASFRLKAGFLAEFPQVLTFSLTENIADLGIISPLAVSATTTKFAVATNAPSGYAVTIIGDTLTHGSSVIDALATPSESSPGNKQFGINLKYNTSPSVGADPSGGAGIAGPGYNSTNFFKFVSDDTIALSNSFSTNTDFTISYLGNISSATEAGSYSTILTVIATGTF